MTGIEKKLSKTARAALTAAKMRPDHLMRPPRLPIAAARQVVRSLLNGGLVEEVYAQIQDDAYAWRTGEDGAAMMLRATALGLARVGAGDDVQELPTAREAVEPDREAVDPLRQLAGAPEAAAVIVAAAQAETQTSGRPAAASTAGETSDGALGLPIAANPQGTLRRTAHALLYAWDDPLQETGKIGALEGLMDALRAALAASTKATSHRSRQPKDTKQAQVLAMLRRQEGASGPAIAEAMGWAPHTVRGFLAGLGKKGVTVEVLERVRQVSANKEGAKGSYTIYRVAE